MVESRAMQSGIAVIAATFTAEPLLPTLQYLFREAGVDLAPRFAPYNQVFQELISSSSEFAVNPRGAGVVLIRVEDFIREIPEVDNARTLIHGIVDEFNEALSAYIRRAKTPTVVAILAPSTAAKSDLLSDLKAATTRLIAMAKSQAGIVTLTSEEIDRLAVGERYDHDSNDLAHIPFTEEYYAALALAITRKLHALLVPARKVLVLDCDNTLWRGVVGEDAVDGVVVTPALAGLQRFAVQVQEQGGLVCLASKNSEQDVLNVFRTRADMVLKLEHIVAHRINWESKPQNLLSLARILNLGPESFVFVDDNPVECEVMRIELPQVTTLLLPSEDNIESFLQHLWTFDKVAVTAEDLRRTNMYKEEAARKEFENSASNIADFMASLEVKVDIGLPEEKEWARLAQLTQRTNQFNFTTVRRSETELRALQGSGARVLSVRVRDRFGNYGLVGVVVFQTLANELLVDSLLLSCRVLGRGVEHAMLRYLGSVAKEEGAGQVCLPYIWTSRNEPAQAFAESVAANFKAGDDKSETYRIPTDYAVGIAHRPGADPDAVIRARDSEKISADVKITSGTNPSERYLTFSQKLVTGRDVLNAVVAAKTRKRTLLGEPRAPLNDTERKMLALWRAVLCVEDIGVEDDYSAMGGTSLLAARLFADIYQTFGMKLPLTSLMEFSTIRALAGIIDSGRQQEKSLIELKKGGSRNIFFVHDGEGETLLYANVARELPAQFSVYGIEPLRLQGVPLGHTRIENMAAHYNRLIRERQPKGPYILGGMCAGGVIAYEMAKQLIESGEPIELVVLLDAALPGTAKRKDRIARKRLGRVNPLVPETRQFGVEHSSFARTIFAKTENTAAWALLRRWWVQGRFWLLRRYLDQGRPWPIFIPCLSIRQIYDFAAAGYRPGPGPSPKLLLLRALSGEGADTPFKEIYADEMLGWGPVRDDLAIVDVNYGHFSMLQEPFAGSLAEKITSYLNLSSATAQQRKLDQGSGVKVFVADAIVT
jgi:FkbH-like protein